MKDFNFKIPQNIQFGMGSLKKLPEILAENHSDNILLVSDRGLEKIGVVKKVQDIIEAAGLKCTSYLDVVPNQGRKADVRVALSNSLGFGGHNAAVVLKKWEE